MLTCSDKRIACHPNESESHIFRDPVHNRSKPVAFCVIMGHGQRTFVVARTCVVSELELSFTGRPCLAVIAR